MSEEKVRRIRNRFEELVNVEIASTRSTCDRGPDFRFRDHKGTGAIAMRLPTIYVVKRYSNDPDPDLLRWFFENGDANAWVNELEKKKDADEYYYTVESVPGSDLEE